MWVNHKTFPRKKTSRNTNTAWEDISRVPSGWTRADSDTLMRHRCGLYHYYSHLHRHQIQIQILAQGHTHKGEYNHLTMIQCCSKDTTFKWSKKMYWLCGWNKYFWCPVELCNQLSVHANLVVWVATGQLLSKQKKSIPWLSWPASIAARKSEL